MDTVRVRFLETRVVDDEDKGTVRETRFEAGGDYELPPRSADRWVKRGAARFLSDEDEAAARGTSSDVALGITDTSRAEGSVAGLGRRVASRADDGENAERIAIADKIASAVVMNRAGISAEDWGLLGPGRQMEEFRKAEAEIDVFLEGLLRGDSAARADYFSKVLGAGGHASLMTVNEVRRIEGLNDIPGGDVIRWPSNHETPASPAEPAISETPAADAGRDVPGTEEQASGIAPGTQEPGSGLPPAKVDFDAMTDEQLREFIDERDGRRPRRDASRETLLAKAKGGAEE